MLPFLELKYLTKILNLERNLSFGRKRIDGRNNQGRITLYHRGGGRKRKYRLVDFFRRRADWAVVLSFDLDVQRSAFLAKICYLNGIFSFIPATESLLKFSKIYSSISFSKVPSKGLVMGSYLPANFAPIGYFFSNLEIYPNRGAQMVRSAGGKAKLLKQENFRSLFRLRSGWCVWLVSSIRLTFGSIGNELHRMRPFRKAGIVRHLGRRPIVRGEAMNPVDHPHGGRTRGGRLPVTPWGRLTRGKPTVNVWKYLKDIKWKFRYKK